MHWCSLFRTALLLQLLSVTKLYRAENGPHSEWNPSREMASRFREVVGLKRSCATTPPHGEWHKPVCKENVGCDVPLNCFNYSLLSKSKLVMARRITPRALERVLENPAITNTCAVVMFYAPWCPYSTDFARRFNALGRTYKELPVLAVEFGDSDM